MATTIKLKSGSGAPLAGDLVAAEPALDLTNKRLYTENASGTVIEVGTNPTSLTTGTFTSTGIDDNATSTAITIDSSQNVGIGTTSPDGKLNVFSASAGSVSADADADELVLENSGNVGLSLLTASTGESGIYFGNPGTNGQKDFYLKYYHESHATTANRRAFTFNTASTERMRIDSSGNVLVGTTNDTPGLGDTDVGASFRADGASFVSRTLSDTSGSTFYVNRNTNDGNLIQFQKDGSTKGSIGINGGDEPYFARSVGTTTGIKIANGALTACQSDGTNHDNSQDLGASSIRWRNLYMAGDAVMGGSSNIIYESGTTFNVRAAVANLTFQTNGANERMRIDSSGHVGIGVTPDAWRTTDSVLQLGSRASVTGLANDTHFSNNAYFDTGSTWKAQDTAQAANYYQSAGIHVWRYAGTTTADTAISWSEAMRIDNSGNLLVGTTVLTDVSSSGTGNEGAYIKSDGSVGLATSNGTVAIFNRKSTHGVMLDFRKDGTTVGSISTNGNSLPSDRNFKKNIEDLRLGLNFVSSLNPVTYNYKMDDDDSPIMTGLIAQDVETALEAAGVEPNSMTLLQHKPIEDEKESDYQMDYLKLVPVLINAVKELSAQVDELKAEVAALKGA